MTENPETPEGEREESAPTEETPEEAPGNPSREGLSNPDQLAAQVAELTARLAEAEPILKAHADAEEAAKTDLQRATDRADAAERKAAELARSALLRTLADETGLPVEAMTRIQGATEDEMRADATALAALLGARPKLKTRPAPVAGGGGGVPDDGASVDPRKLAAAIRRLRKY
ncbi:hypothetical protein ACWDRR_00630 [Kitasatospora sp. NPDC003701]